MVRPGFQTRVAEAILEGVIRFREHLASEPYAPVADADGRDRSRRARTAAEGSPDAPGRD